MAVPRRVALVWREMKPEKQLLRVLIADDSAVVRERQADLLRELPGVSVVAETTDVAGTLEQIRSLQPEVVLLDLGMPGGSGLDVLRQMRAEQLHATVIVLTNYRSVEYEKAVREYGAIAFLDKSRDFMKAAELICELAERAGTPLTKA